MSVLNYAVSSGNISVVIPFELPLSLVACWVVFFTRSAFPFGRLVWYCFYTLPMFLGSRLMMFVVDWKVFLLCIVILRHRLTFLPQLNVVWLSAASWVLSGLM